MLLDTYKSNVEKAIKSNPNAEFIEITRSVNHILSPSLQLLSNYKNKKITWEEYVIRFEKEMHNEKCCHELLRIGELARYKDVILVCYERNTNKCHRFIIMDIIKQIYPNLKVVKSF